MKPKKEARESGIELLRIILMMQIIMLHTYYYSGYSDFAKTIGGNHKLFAGFMMSFFNTPVDVFLIISGYFMIYNQFGNKNYINRIIKVYLPALFYSVVLGLICINFYPYGITHSNYNPIKIFTPFFSKSWYFISNYILIVIFIPFINITLQKLTQKQYIRLLGLLGVLLSIWPNLSSFFPFGQIFSVNKIIDTFDGKSLISFLFMYIIGGYLRLFVAENRKIRLLYLVSFFGFSMIDFGLKFISEPHVFEYNKIAGRYDNPFVICGAIALFLFFREIKFKSRIVNSIAGTTFGIYMIHEFAPIRILIWTEIFNLKTKYHYIFNDKSYIIKVYVIMLLIFISCMVIEYTRQFLFSSVEKIITKVKKNKNSI